MCRGRMAENCYGQAVFNPAPVRILDEPTASLDPVSESRMYKEFEKISRDKQRFLSAIAWVQPNWPMKYLFWAMAGSLKKEILSI